ncbi:MAG TPA: hypothetical protein VFG14_10880 [Chthoniobacteraceae bacterium]|nr:hypothetical protein [Chthoniobacteraceae bacterium]
MRKPGLVLTVASGLFIAFAIALPWGLRWYLGSHLPTLSAIPVEEVAAIEVSGTEIPIGDLRFVLPEGTSPELDDSRKRPHWSIQIGARNLKMFTPTFWKTWDPTIGICCEDPRNTPYVEQLRQVYSVSSDPGWLRMRSAEFNRYSKRIRCAYFYRSPSATRLMILSRPGYHVCVVDHEGRAADISVIEDDTQKIWGFMLISPEKDTTREDLIDFASRIRLPR